MTPRKQQRLEELREYHSEAADGGALLADGLEEAFIGICRRFGQEPLAAYDYEKVLSILMKRDGMTYEEAVEFFDFNIIGAWAGEGTPVFIET